MFLKEKNVGHKGRMSNLKKFLTDTLAKTSQNILREYSKAFFYFEKKKLLALFNRAVLLTLPRPPPPPPPPTTKILGETS